MRENQSYSIQQIKMGNRRLGGAKWVEVKVQ